MFVITVAILAQVLSAHGFQLTSSSTTAQEDMISLTTLASVAFLSAFIGAFIGAFVGFWVCMYFIVCKRASKRKISIPNDKMTIIVGRRRITRKASKTSRKALTMKNLNNGLYWRAYINWVKKHEIIPLFVRPYFTFSDYADKRGRLIMVKLECIMDDVPIWFPSYKELTDEQERNFLHFSICFTGDLKKMNPVDREIAKQHIERLSCDPDWNGKCHETTTYHIHSNGTFHLRGFESDFSMHWLHEHGSYCNRIFGHIALYPGGLSC